MELCPSITGIEKLRNFVRLGSASSPIFCRVNIGLLTAWICSRGAPGINIDKVVMQISTHSSADVRVLVLFRLCRTIDPRALGCALTESSVSAALRALLTAPTTAAEVVAQHKRVRTCRDGVSSDAGTVRQPPFERRLWRRRRLAGLGRARHGQTDSDCHRACCHARRISVVWAAPAPRTMCGMVR